LDVGSVSGSYCNHDLHQNRYRDRYAHRHSDPDQNINPYLDQDFNADRHTNSHQNHYPNLHIHPNSNDDPLSHDDGYLYRDFERLFPDFDPH
jgi:hypothetical protein